MVSDQNALVGGSCPASKCMTWSCRPFSVRPEPSEVVHQYIASSGTAIGPGNVHACAARKNMPLPGWPHPYIVVHPFDVVALSRP